MYFLVRMLSSTAAKGDNACERFTYALYTLT